jgi:AcrR family transcriptional regulator
MIRDDSEHDETRVERRKRQTRDRIFRTALDLFLKRGLDETTVAEIADAADIGKGTFFTYFPTKESVFSEVTLQLTDAMEDALEEARTAGAPIEARLFAFFRPAIAWHASNPVLSRYMLAAFMHDATSLRVDRASQRRLYERLAGELADAQAAGAITRDVELPAAVTAIAGTYFGSLGAWHGVEAQTALTEDFAASLRVVLRGLRP